jgi:hypothetical protein
MSVSRSNSTSRSARFERLGVRPAAVEQHVAGDAAGRDQVAGEQAERVAELERELARAAGRMSAGAARCEELEGQLARQDAERRSMEGGHRRQLEDVIHPKATAEAAAACGAVEHRPAGARSRIRAARWGLASLVGMVVLWWVVAHLVVILVVLGLLAVLAGGRR